MCFPFGRPSDTTSILYFILPGIMKNSQKRTCLFVKDSQYFSLDFFSLFVKIEFRVCICGKKIVKFSQFGRCMIMKLSQIFESRYALYFSAQQLYSAALLWLRFPLSSHKRSGGSVTGHLAFQLYSLYFRYRRSRPVCSPDKASVHLQPGYRRKDYLESRAFRLYLHHRAP